MGAPAFRHDEHLVAEVHDGPAVELDLTDAALASGLAGQREGGAQGGGNGPPRRRALLLGGVSAVVAVLAAVVAVSGVAAAPSEPTVLGGPVRASALATLPAGVDAYRGLGAWVDIYDYAPAYQGAGSPVITPDRVAEMAAAGVRTLFLQTAGTDRRTPGDLVDARLAGEFLAAAHRHGLRVVGWYGPTLADVDGDLRRLRAVADFRAGAERFDGIAVDIETHPEVPDPATRSRRLVDLSRRLRQSVGKGLPLAAIVPPPVLLEEVNPALWPAFPWRDLRDLYDVWIPMAYRTLRTDRDPARYTRENLRRLRLDLGDPGARLHALGGVGNAATEADVRSFLRAARAEHALGASVYDYRSLSLGGLAVLAAGVSPDGFGDEELHE